MSISAIFSQRFSIRQCHRYLNKKETFVIFHLLKTWITIFKNSHLIIYCDNEKVVMGLQKLTLRGLAMKSLQDLLILANLNDISIESFWIPTHSNVLANLLSKRKFKLIADKFPSL